jgi:hypothetical protein
LGTIGADIPATGFSDMIHGLLTSVAIVALFLGALAAVNQIVYMTLGDEVEADDNAVDAADQRAMGPS